jgi:Ni,Fe-hydrogenase III large subunit
MRIAYRTADKRVRQKSCEQELMLATRVCNNLSTTVSVNHVATMDRSMGCS